MKVLFVERAEKHYEYLKKYFPKLAQKVDELIEDIKRSPYTGIGKPEPLRFELSGLWSRRINHEHRLVYKIDGSKIIVYQCRFHYTNN